MKLRLIFSTEASILAEDPLKVIYVLKSFKKKEYTKMLNAYGLKSKEIGDSLCENLKTPGIPWTDWKVASHFKYLDYPFFMSCVVILNRTSHLLVPHVFNHFTPKQGDNATGTQRVTERVVFLLQIETKRRCHSVK